MVLSSSDTLSPRIIVLLRGSKRGEGVGTRIRRSRGGAAGIRKKVGTAPHLVRAEATGVWDPGRLKAVNPSLLPQPH